MQVSVNGRFEGQRVTGVQRYARELLARMGSQVTVVSPREPMRGVRGHLWEQSVLPRKFKGNLLWSPCNSGPLAVSRQIVTIHDCGFHDHAECFSPFFVKWYRWMIPLLARRARQVITVSEFSRQRLMELARIREERITVIPNGVSERFQPATPDTIAEMKERLGLPERYILSVGTLEPRKNLARLFQAWRQLAVREPDVSLVVVGMPNHVFRAVNVEDDLPRTCFTGHVDDRDLPTIYAGSELFVFPSLYEGFGLPVVEAMASGLPVLTSSTSSLGEIAGDAAETIDPTDTGAILDAMLRLARDPELRRERSERGIARARTFSWTQTAREMLAVYHRLAGVTVVPPVPAPIDANDTVVAGSPALSERQGFALPRVEGRSKLS